MRARVIFGGLLLVVLALLGLVLNKELLRVRGTRVLLELAPVDPRSLMQGDYMRLDYAVNREVRPRLLASLLEPSKLRDGRMVLRLDENGVGRFVREETPGTPLAPGELLLRYKQWGFQVRVGAESFFFQEGLADHYAQAKYGELRVTSDGTPMLVGLCDAQRQPLGSPLQ